MSRQLMTEHPKQHEILRYIIDYKTDHEGASPTIREIQQACGLASPSTTRHYLYLLVQDNAIEMHGTRDIRVNGASWSMG